MKVHELIKLLEDSIPKNKRHLTEIYFLEDELNEKIDTYREFEISSIATGQIISELTFLLKPLDHPVS